MSDVKCPYCGLDNEICHDDGFGYEEGVVHEQQCYECEKYYIFYTSIIFHYKSYKADCLNGSEHRFKASITVPVRYTKMICQDCDLSRKPNDQEMSEIVRKRESPSR